MKRLFRGLGLTVAAGLAILATSLMPVPQADSPSLVLFTQVDAAADPDERFPERAAILALSPGQAPEVITSGFHAARAPSMSFDGRRILFAAKREAGDPWQIYEMRLDNRKTRVVTRASACEAEAGFGCTDPAYLPDDRIVFSAPVDGSYGAGGTDFALYTSDIDGGDLRRITFHPAQDFSSTLMQDGRVLFASRTAPGEPPRLMAVRYDGTGIELLAPDGERARQLPSGDFAVSEPSGNLAIVSGRRPLHGRRHPASGIVHSAAAGPDGTLLVSRKSASDASYALYVLDPASGAIEPALYQDASHHALDPLLVAAHPRPIGFVSAVEPEAQTAFVYGLDADDSSIPASEVSRSLRIEAPEGILAEVPLEVDGSFNLEIPPDVPLQFTTLDDRGRVVRGPSAWIWLRPNEQRGCVGCHEDRELAPANRLPEAIKRPAVPVHVHPRVALHEELP